MISAGLVSAGGPSTGQGGLGEEGAAPDVADDQPSRFEHLQRAAHATGAPTAAPRARARVGSFDPGRRVPVCAPRGQQARSDASTTRPVAISLATNS
jgi:hypothetical protein